MSLKYRGLTYEEHSSDIVTYETSISAKFRGFTYHIRRPIISTKVNSQATLKYRGANYFHG